MWSGVWKVGALLDVAALGQKVDSRGFSESMSRCRVWTDLSEWLRYPQEHLPGTNMQFGVSHSADIVDSSHRTWVRLDGFREKKLLVRLKRRHGTDLDSPGLALFTSMM